jgi:hypothetical protein
LPFYWDITEAFTREEYAEGLKSGPDLVVFQSNPNMEGHHDAVLINMVRHKVEGKPDVHLVIVLTDKPDHPLPDANPSELIIHFNRNQWTKRGGGLRWVEMLEACRGAAEVGCA